MHQRITQTFAISQALLCLGVLLTVAVLSGCGSDGADDTNTEANSGGQEDDPLEFVAPNVISSSEIEAQEEGSPEWALLTWWQAFQFSDVQQVLALTSNDTLKEIGEDELTELVSELGPGLQKVEVDSARVEGDESVVRGVLLSFDVNKDGSVSAKPSSALPQSFQMSEEQEDWKFNQTAYLEELLENFDAGSG